jgi:hypothetical protein
MKSYDLLVELFTILPSEIIGRIYSLIKPNDLPSLKFLISCSLGIGPKEKFSISILYFIFYKILIIVYPFVPS